MFPLHQISYKNIDLQWKALTCFELANFSNIFVENAKIPNFTKPKARWFIPAKVNGKVVENIKSTLFPWGLIVHPRGPFNTVSEKFIRLLGSSGPFNWEA